MYFLKPFVVSYEGSSLFLADLTRVWNTFKFFSIEMEILSFKRNLATHWNLKENKTYK